MEPRQWGDSGRVQVVRREYALYDDVLLDGVPIGMVWLRGGTAWCYAMWADSAHRVSPGEASSFDDAVTRILWLRAPELVPPGSGQA